MSHPLTLTHRPARFVWAMAAPFAPPATDWGMAWEQANTSESEAQAPGQQRLDFVGVFGDRNTQN